MPPRPVRGQRALGPDTAAAAARAQSHGLTRVRLGERSVVEEPGPAPVDSWMGQSYCKWEGDTLVVEVTGLLPDSWLDRSGNHHSEQMKVTERYTMTSPNHIQYEATIDDPATFEKAWKISMPLYRRLEPNMQLMDFRCVEFVEELLFGAWRRNPLPRPPPPLAQPR